MTEQHDGRNGHVYVASAARMPIGKFGGAHSTTLCLGGDSVAAAFERVA